MLDHAAGARRGTMQHRVDRGGGRQPDEPVRQGLFEAQPAVTRQRVVRMHHQCEFVGAVRQVLKGC